MTPPSVAAMWDQLLLSAAITKPHNLKHDVTQVQKGRAYLGKKISKSEIIVRIYTFRLTVSKLILNQYA